MPLIIAHRGASAAAPENTLPAFALALDMGAAMLELDVWRCGDGTLVVTHDATTARWEVSPRPLAACSLADLRALAGGTAQVPTLAEVCALAHRRGALLNVELKHPAAVPAAITLVHTAGLVRQVLFSAFNPTTLHALRQMAPDLPRGYLMGTDTAHPRTRARELWPFFALRQAGASAWHPASDLPLLRRVLPLVRRAGYAVYVWTVDDPVAMRRLVGWGASGIITNRPDLARAVLSAT
jgi:glycerophosphoryl diester phosphodiesterase